MDQIQALDVLGAKHGFGGKFSTVLDAAVLTLLLIFGAFAALVGYWLFGDHSVMRITELRVLTPTVVAGQLVKYQMSYCKNPDYVDLQADVTFQLKDSSVISIPGYSAAHLDSGCHTVVQSQGMPSFIPPDQHYTLVMTRRYKPNPLVPNELVVAESVNTFAVASHVPVDAKEMADLTAANRMLIGALSEQKGQMRQLTRANRALVAHINGLITQNRKLLDAVSNLSVKVEKGK